MNKQNLKPSDKIVLRATPKRCGTFIESPFGKRTTKDIYSNMNRTVAFLLLILIGAIIPSCKNDPAQIKLLTSKGNFQEDRAEEITGIYSKNGKVKARLFALEYVKNEAANPPYTDLNRQIRVEFYNDSGALQQVLTADSCRIYDASGNAIVWGNVKIVTTKGEQLNTEELVWNNKIQKIFTEKPVKITTGSEVLYGNGLEANQDFSWYQITNPRGSVAVKKGEMPD